MMTMHIVCKFLNIAPSIPMILPFGCSKTQALLQKVKGIAFAMYALYLYQLLEVTQCRGSSFHVPHITILIPLIKDF